MELPPVQYATTSDGKNIAYTVTGRGRPLVFMPLTLNHVQLSWRYERRLTGWLRELSARYQLVRYDSRGQGMSTRGMGPSHCIEDYEIDLETVVDHLGLERFILLGYVYFSHVAVRFAVQHPERLQALVLVSPAASSAVWPVDATRGLVTYSWDIFLRNFVPDGSSREETEHIVGYFHQAMTPADFEAHMRAVSASNVTELLPSLKVPTLIIHPPGFLWTPTEEVEGVAALVPHSRLALIDGNMALGDHNQGIRVIEDFIASQPGIQSAAGGHAPSGLSTREIDVLSLLAQGLTNQQIADRLVISINTVARHVASILSKTGTRNRTEASLLAGERRQPPRA
jgi:pimeloyl-ACP methyl ester carboxylesterase/DNA-binding CsgD family transcriptional regulator